MTQLSDALRGPDLAVALRCCDCGGPMRRLPSRFGTAYWCCEKGCDVKAYEHKDGRLKSSPAGPALRALRMEAHKAASALWDYEDREQRRAMYLWLGEHTTSGHIGFLTEAECRKLVGMLDFKSEARA